MGPSKRKSTPAGVEDSAEKATERADGDVPPVKRVRIGDTSVVATTPTTEAEDQDPGERRKRQGRKRKKKLFAEKQKKKQCEEKQRRSIVVDLQSRSV